MNVLREVSKHIETSKIPAGMIAEKTIIRFCFVVIFYEAKLFLNIYQKLQT